MTALFRTVRGSVMTVHRSDCRVLAKVPDARKWPWNWAEGKPQWEIFDAPWNVPCKVCRP